MTFFQRDKITGSFFDFDKGKDKTLRLQKKSKIKMYIGCLIRGPDF